MREFKLSNLLDRALEGLNDRSIASMTQDRVHNMCPICSLFLMYNAGYVIGFSRTRTQGEWTKNDDTGNWEMKYEMEMRWISPQERKQGFINREED